MTGSTGWTLAGKGWVRLAEINGTVTKCRSVGLIVAKDDCSLTLAEHIGEEPEQCCGDLTIPKCAIRKVMILREVGKKLFYLGQAVTAVTYSGCVATFRDGGW